MIASATTRPSAGDLHRFIAELYPICRSIAGDRVRETLSLIGEVIPIDVQ